MREEDVPLMQEEYVFRVQEEHVLLVHGSGFSKEFGSGHFRIVFIPEIEILEEAFARINRFIN